MKRILTITLFILFVLPAISQVSPPSPQSRVAGRFVASNYGQWSLPIYSFPAGTGSLTFTLSSSTVRLPDGRLTMPFNTNASIRVGSETVTPSAVGTGCILNSTVIGGCSITATFSNAHSTSDQVLSATFGLQEALNDAGNSGGGAVTIDSAWTNAGGTTAIKNAATLPSSTGIEDVRTGAISGGTGTVTSVTFTGDGVVDSSTPSSAVTTTGTVTATIKTQTANTVLAGPTTGSAANAAFRALVSADIPNNAANTTGTSGGLSGSPAITVSSCTGCGGGGAGNYVNLGGTVTFAVGSGSGSYASGTYTIATAASSVTISSIPSGYNRIDVKVNAESSSGSNDLLDIQINADTGSDYWSLAACGGISGSHAAGTFATVGVLGFNSGPTIPGYIDLTFPDYTGTTFPHLVAGQGASWSGGPCTTTSSALWYKVTQPAMTSVKLFTENAANFTAGSTFSIYGEN